MSSIGRLIRKNHAAVFWCTRHYPKAKREAVYTLYALFKHFDDLTSSLLPAKEKAEILAAWQEEVVNIYEKKVPVTDKDAFDMRNISNIAVHVPADLVDAYRESDPWKNFKEIVPIEGSQPTVINTIETNCTKTRYYTINGYIITATRKGFYIKNGSKIIR